MPRQIFAPRKHQRELIEKLKEIVEDYKVTGELKTKKLVEEVFPGGGKSLHPLIAGRILIDAGIIDKVCWVVPRTSLKVQGAQECLKPEMNSIFRHGLVLREVENANDAEPTRGTDGFIITYQGLVSARGNNRSDENNHHKDFRRFRYLLFLDEVHHVTPDPPQRGGDREGYSYYQAVKPLFERAAFVICASGTLMRNNNERVAFIDYVDKAVDGEIKHVPKRDVVYTYKNSLEDRANIRLFYNTGETAFVKYTKNDREFRRDKIENGDDRRIAISTEYGRALLDAGLKAWEDYQMRVNPRSKLIVIGRDQQSCYQYASIIGKAGHKFALAISDEKKEAHASIKRFRSNPDCKILVTCQMAYEGLDCKQATHVIVLTDIRSLPWLIQMLTRVMRADTHEEALPYEKQYAMCFCPDDEDMINAIKAVQGEPDTSISKKDEDLDRLLDLLENNAQNYINKPSKPLFTECSSGMAGISQIAPDGEKLPADTRAKIEQFALRENLHMAETEIYKLLRITGSLHVLNGVAEAVPPPAENVGMTVREQEVAWRKKIQDEASRLDYKFGWGWGEWNKRVHNHFRHTNRKDMSVEKLSECYDWMISEAKRLVAEMKDRKDDHKKVADPIANYDPVVHSS